MEPPEFIWNLGDGLYDDVGVNDPKFMDHVNEKVENIWSGYKLWIEDIRNALSKADKLRDFWVLVGDNRHVIATVIFQTTCRVSFAIHRVNAYIYSYRINETTYYFNDAPPTDVFRFPGTALVKLSFSSQYTDLQRGFKDIPTYGLEGIQAAVKSLFNNTKPKKMIFMLLNVIAESVRFHYIESKVAVAQDLGYEAGVIRGHWGQLCQRIQEADENNRDEFDKPLQLEDRMKMKIGSITESRRYLSLIKVVNDKSPTKKQNKGKQSWDRKQKKKMS